MSTSVFGVGRFRAGGWVSPASGGTVALGKYRLVVPAGVVAELCFASILRLPERRIAAWGEKTAVEGATDFHLACEWTGLVTITVPLAASVQSGRDNVFIPHLVREPDEFRLERATVNPDGTASASVSDLSISFLGYTLNEREVSWCFLHVTRLNACVRVFTELAPIAARTRIALFPSNDPAAPDPDDDRGNAFKHCFWNALMVLEVGLDHAKSIAENHEWGRTDESSQMDRHNNGVGQSVGSEVEAWFEAAMSCRGKALFGGLQFIRNGSRVDTSTPDHTATSPPPPPTQSTLSVSLWENPFRCDGGSRQFGKVSGAQPGEQVTFNSPELGALLPGTANAAGEVAVRWTCSDHEAGRTWHVNARGTTTGRTVSFSVTGASASQPQAPSGPARISLSQGGQAPSGYWYSVVLSSFAAGSSVTVTCRDSVDPQGFWTQTFTIDSSGQASDSTLCYSADGPDHWVTGGGVESNHVAWGSGPPPPPPPPPSASVSIAKGASAVGLAGCSHSSCRWVDVRVSAFPANTRVTVVCRASNGDEGGFWTYTKTTDSAGSGSWPGGSAGGCYYGFPGRTLWVTVNGIESNRIVW